MAADTVTAPIPTSNATIVVDTATMRETATTETNQKKKIHSVGATVEAGGATTFAFFLSSMITDNALGALFWFFSKKNTFKLKT
jgi:hypothetical protein